MIPIPIDLRALFLLVIHKVYIEIGKNKIKMFTYMLYQVKLFNFNFSHNNVIKLENYLKKKYYTRYIICGNT